MSMIDNIIVGELVKGLTPLHLGILPEEKTKYITNNPELFLPRLLVQLNIFKTTSEIKRIHQVRIKSNRIKDENERNLWRTLNEPEMTRFKIGKKVFWLFVSPF